MNFSPRTLILLSVWALAGCAAKVSDFDQKLDGRIQTELDKRAQLVQGNPVYATLVSELTKGRQLLTAGQAKEAFVIFDKIMADNRYNKFPEYWYAKYYLACALYEMGVDYGALLYFVDIVRREPLRAHTHEALRRAIAIAQKLHDDELILFLASDITPDKVPRSLREEFRYFIAKAMYQKNQFDKSSELLTSISHKNRLYLAALYLRGTMAVREKDYRGAIKYFQELSNTRSPIAYYENHRIRQLGNLALGRLYYETQNYPLSVVYYKKVERDGEFYPSSLYEASWALFKLNKFNETLSVLHTLNSPFYEQIYFLKSYLLHGAIDIELCNYEEAVKTLSSVENKFITLRDQIDRFARLAKSPEEYYPLLSSKKRNLDGSEVYAYASLFNLASANRDFLSRHHYIQHLYRERDILRETPSSRSTLLSQLVNQKATELKKKASYMAGKKLLLTRQMIADFESLKTEIRTEIVTAERKILQKRALSFAPPVAPGQDLIRPEFTESLRETLIWWDYNGEYWKDELGYYLVDRKTRCKDESQGQEKK